MSMKANDYSGGGNYEAPPPLESGAYNSRTVQILNIGLQKQNPYKGEDKPPKYELYVTYELSDEFLEDEDGEPDLTKPRWVGERFTINSLESENAKSTKRYLALDPNNQFEGDWSQVLNTPCVVTLVQNKSKKKKDVIYNNVASVQPMRSKDAAKLPALVNEPKVFDFYEPDVKVFLSLPGFLQKIIKESLDFSGSKLENLLEDVSETDTKEKRTGKNPVKEVAAEGGSDDDESW